MRITLKEKDAIRRLNIKQSVLTHYGNGICACVRCGFSDIRALSIDHINNDGASHRKQVGGGSRMYIWLLENKFPNGYQTLCMNCQFIRRFEKDKFVLPEKYIQSLTKRVRHWVSIREDGFNIRDVMVGLGLEDEKRVKVRGILGRLCTEDKVTRRRPGYFTIVT